MKLCEMIQVLRKKKGISQEELADILGVSRQAVSKWESEQSIPDVDKIILMSEYFNVTTDYLLKGIETKNTKVDARLFTIISTTINFIGLIVSIMIWVRYQRDIAAYIGLIIIAIGCMIFVIGQVYGKDKKRTKNCFIIFNIWLISLIPLSSIFNFLSGIIGRYYWMVSPLPMLGNSLFCYGLFWLMYFVICLLTDILVIKKNK